MRMLTRYRSNWEHRHIMLRRRDSTPGLFAERIRRRFFLHVLPFFLMLLVLGWLSLKAGHIIDRSKQPPGYASMTDH